MKQAMKKALAVLLAALVMLGVGGVGAGASEAGKITTIEFPDDFDKDAVEELELGVSKIVPGYEYRFFKFTPAESGHYCFLAEDPNRDTRVALLDAEGDMLDYFDSWYNRPPEWSFKIFYQLEAGRTYYLLIYTYGSGNCTVTLEASSGKLNVPKTNVTVYHNKRVSLAALLKGTTWDLRHLRVSQQWNAQWVYDEKNDRYDYIMRFYRGETTIRVTAPDGEWVEIAVTAKFTVWQWVQHYILFGWWDAMESDDQAWLLVYLLCSPLIILFSPYILLRYLFTR